MLLGKLAAWAVLGQFALPPQAKLIVDGRYRESGYGVEMPSCIKFHLKPQDVRRRFSEYHKLDGEEIHSDYAWYGCGLKGRIISGGKVFLWKAEPCNTIKTNWPRGEWTLLGGEPTDDPSGGESGRKIANCSGEHNR